MRTLVASFKVNAPLTADPKAGYDRDLEVLLKQYPLFQRFLEQFTYFRIASIMADGREQYMVLVHYSDDSRSDLSVSEAEDETYKKYQRLLAEVFPA